MFIKLDQAVIDILRCPLCKNRLTRQLENDNFACDTCASRYPAKMVDVGDHAETVYDFQVHRPPYCMPRSKNEWLSGQKEYELFDSHQTSQDRLDAYLAEIDSVKEIYRDEFNIRGSILDVGGHQGRLRHFLSDDEVPLYISVDPFLNAFENIQSQPNLLRAYPCLSEACNFLSAEAEHLPFDGATFDWVHIRSALDHFEDPFVALKEAYRVLRPDGKVLVGLAIMEKFVEPPTTVDPLPLLTRVRRKFEREGFGGVARRLLHRLKQIGRNEAEEDHHTFRLTHAQLLEMVTAAGFTVTREHWQKPPFNFCLYLTGTKKS